MYYNPQVSVDQDVLIERDTVLPHFSNYNSEIR